MPLKTMLAETLRDEDFTEALFDNGPLIVQPKFDGIRVQVERGVAYSGREGKLLPNAYVQSWCNTYLLGAHLDGELMVKDDDGGYLPFADIILPDMSRIRGIESWLMTRGGAPKFEYVLFDDLNYPHMQYKKRLALAINQIEFLRSMGQSKYITFAQYREVTNAGQLIATECDCVDGGYEGMCARLASGRYKEGRSTLRERLLLKHKRRADAEAVIVGWEPLFRQTGEMDNTLLGALICRSPAFDETFKLGTGYSLDLRRWFRENVDSLIHNRQTITFKYQKHGTRTRPRSPVFWRIRNSD